MALSTCGPVTELAEVAEVLLGDLDFRNGEFEGEHSGVDFLSVKIRDNTILDTANIEKKNTYRTLICGVLNNSTQNIFS